MFSHQAGRVVGLGLCRVPGRLASQGWSSQGCTATLQTALQTAHTDASASAANHATFLPALGSLSRSLTGTNTNNADFDGCDTTLAHTMPFTHSGSTRWPLICATGSGAALTIMSQAVAEPEVTDSKAPPSGGWYAYVETVSSEATDEVAAPQYRGVTSAEDAKFMQSLDVKLYQYQPCPFCNKVRAFLDYTDIPWTSVEVDPLRKAEIKWSEYRKVPICTMSDEEQASVQMNDSSSIMDSLCAMLPSTANKPHQPSAPDAIAQVEKWRTWVDDWLVHLLVANIYRTWDESMQAFDYLLTNGNFPTMQRTTSRYAGAAIMYGLSHYKLNKKYGIDHPREQMYEAVDEWVGALGSNDFLGQSEAPTLADISVFGVIRAIEGYPTFVDVMENSNLENWYNRMKARVGDSSLVATADA